MRKLFLFIVLSGCGGNFFSSLPSQPGEPPCLRNFVLKNYETEEMQECNKEDLIKDFEDYIVYIKHLIEIGERTYEPEVFAVPKKLYTTKAVYCFESCSVIPYVRKLCHHWEDDHRKTRKRDFKKAQKEIEDNPICASRWKDFKAHTPIRIQYDWKQTEKYKKLNSGK